MSVCTWVAWQITYFTLWITKGDTDFVIKAAQLDKDNWFNIYMLFTQISESKGIVLRIKGERPLLFTKVPAFASPSLIDLVHYYFAFRFTRTHMHARTHSGEAVAVSRLLLPRLPYSSFFKNHFIFALIGGSFSSLPWFSCLASQPPYILQCALFAFLPVNHRALLLKVMLG